MAFVRSIGRWTLTALVINCIIGGGIFGLPGEVTRLLGRASPLAMIFAALGMAVIIACITEVGSQFSEAGGPYLYVRTAFGRFMGLQIGWFHLLVVVAPMAALANLFVNYLGTFLAAPLNTWERGSLMAILIAIPAVANCFGVRSGANLSNVVTIAKLVPLGFLILFGVGRFVHQPQLIHVSEIASPGLSNWVSAMVLLLFAYGGWENALIPTGEMREPRRTIPVGLGTGLLVCAAIYALLQFITVATIGAMTTDRPLAQTASVLLGHGGAAFVAIAAMLSTYGWISGAILSGPRLAYSLAAQGDFPAFLARLHPRFHTPIIAILFCAITGWVLAFSGTFLWLVALSSGATMILYSGMCASLIRLRKLRPNALALRIPFGPVLAALGVAICLALTTGLKRREVLLMCITALAATINWLWARRYHWELETKSKAKAVPVTAA
jgi:basic amino acid/polyamine antiporter, APA family